MPVWLPLLIAAINDAPAIIRAIELAKLPPISDEQMALLQMAMNKAVEKLDAEIAAK